MNKLGFIGAGKMATAIAKGLLEKKVFTRDQMIAADPNGEAKKAFEYSTGIRCIVDNQEAIKVGNPIILAVKPQMAREVLSTVKSLIEKKLFISIAAGLSINKFTSWINSKRIVRVMPNTPLIVGQGVSVYSCSPDVTSEDRKLIEKIFGAVGIVRELDESRIDAVTALSGSGPGYVFEFIQSLIEAGKSIGLDPKISSEFVVQTVAGATEMVRQRLGTPEELRNNVTSPGGTTEAALNFLKQAGFRKIVSEAIQCAKHRSVELGKDDGK